jgi:hypothetical protein
VLWTAAWTLRNRCAEPADLKCWIFRSLRRTTWCEAEGLERGGVGAQLVGNRPLGRKALLLEELAHQPYSGPFIPARLDQQVEDFALLVDGSPQVHSPAGDRYDHLVEVPSARSGRSFDEFAGAH